jgi:hypothetical protein
MSQRPEQLIRDYLEEHGGAVVVSARHLVTTWELERWTAAAKERVGGALASVGVETDPPLGGTRRDDPVRLYLTGRDGGSGAGRPQEAASPPKSRPRRLPSFLATPRRRSVLVLAGAAAVFVAGVARAVDLGPGGAALTAATKSAHEEHGSASNRDAPGSDRHAGHREEGPTPPAALDDGRYALQLSEQVVPVGARRLSFTVTDTRTGDPLKRFEEDMTKKLHLIVSREDLTGFQHVHPTLERDGTWSVRLRPLAPGAYRAFADFTTAGEKRVLGTDLFVGGRAPLLRVPPPNRGTLTGPFQVYLNSRQPSAGETVTLRFGVRKELARVVLEPYLGARGHLVVLREGDLAYLHVHVDEDALAFETTFPSPGRYRAFLEFAAGGRVYTAPFTIDV